MNTQQTSVLTTEHVASTVPGPATPRAAASTDQFVRELYAEHGTALLAYAARGLGNDLHRAQDLVQETAVRAWRHGPSLTLSADGIRPWLFRVLRNLVIDEHRARAARPDVLHELDDAVAPVGDGTDRALTVQVVREALTDLTAQQREILHHTYFRGLSVNQVSELLGIPPGTAKSRTFYAMRALQRALAARGVLG
ncbi:sigma-70 family RNA polymerase sigma factor [Streptomyces lavenduligriseus]|uniref:Sigma-70 family RNA polymerase sigma factor n=1 Tax=Streptomyces lavenduligriseus TaxID=67315 RepID=A0ABT0NMI3_9ACTN|nr:sigma-70 family RNA polymerase sigma factor [Streptomyces lavenduligriseus]MCL3992062.1 sigma-70 family RNA polymerase sigma factor [Streptomyces lavenduligriseus]